MSSHPTTPRRGPPSRRTLAAVAIGIAAVLVGGIVAFAMTGGTPESTPSPTPRPTATPSPRPTASPTRRPTPTPSPSPAPAARCPLDGEPLLGTDGQPLPEGSVPEEPALAVQIENHPEARPGRNISKAEIVVETLVEGDTTRFTAIFLCEPTLGMTGPVRSARYHNIDLWQDIHVLTVGFGASPGAVERFINAGMPYPNGIEGGWPWYARYGPRTPPHNLYVDLEAMRADLDAHERLVALADRVEPLRPPWSFSDEPEFPGGREVNSLRISTNSYWHFGWDWDENLQAYIRSDQGVEVEDEVTEEPLAFTSLIVQRVTQDVVFGDPDPGGFPRRFQHLVGSGEGVLYTQGRAYAISWSRPTAADRTTWTYTDTGEPIVLPPGEIWWHILPHESAVTEG